jgi:hypothetical protein
MKINLTKLLNIMSQLIVAVPTIAEAVKPIVHEVKGTKKVPAAGAQPSSGDAGIEPATSQ